MRHAGSLPFALLGLSALGCTLPVARGRVLAVAGLCLFVDTAVPCIKRAVGALLLLCTPMLVWLETIVRLRCLFFLTIHEVHTK